MEAATVPATAAVPRQRLREFLGKYGLIIVLLALPVGFAIHDLVVTGSLVRLGENLVAGLSNGAIWALVAIGYTLVYGIVELINFAHGEVFMIGSFTAASFFATIGLTTATGTVGLFFGLALTLIVCMVASGMLNVMIERVAYRPLRNAPEARAADHRGRLLVHPAERRHPLEGRLARRASRTSSTRSTRSSASSASRSPTATCSPSA